MEFNQPLKRSRDEFESDNFQHPQDQQEQEEKRQHIDPAKELVNNVCKDIRRIGENSNIVNQIDDVSYISNPIVAEFEKIDELRNSILATIYSIIIEQPQKINAISNLILICNAKNFVVAKYVIEYLHTKVQELLDNVGAVKSEDNKDEENDKKVIKEIDELEENAGIFNNIKSILKFLATLSPIIENHSIINIFRQFLQLSIDLQNNSSSRNGIAQEIFYNTLISIPYILTNESGTSQDEVIELINKELIELAKTFQIIDDGSNSLVQPFDSKLDNYELPYQPKKLIDLILPSILDLQSKNWSSDLFLEFQELLEPIIKEALSNNEISNELIQHKLPQFKIPELDILTNYKPQGSIDKLWYENTRLIFQVYNITTDFETVPSIESFYGLFFKDISSDILTNLSFNKNEAAIQLSILDLFYNRNLFAPPGSSIDTLTAIHKDNESGENAPPLSTWKVEDIAVESILTMIFQLPTPLHKEIYYYTVLISCCKESPESIAPVFGRAIRLFYNNLETLDFELKIRFMDWMTTQISNFDFSWKWDEWVDDSIRLKNLRYHPKKNFIRNLIAKEIRLSNKQRIQESFITINPETSEMENIKEFEQYLNISLFENESKYIVEYDTELYGGKEEVQNVLEDLLNEKQQDLRSRNVVGAQEEIFYNFYHQDLPLGELSQKVNDFIMSHYKPNNEFEELYEEVLENCRTSFPEINSEKFIINLFFQTYAFIGSRSIYSVVSILDRDVNKLRFLSGNFDKIHYFKETNEVEFKNVELTPEQIENRQNWIIDSILRIWIHQPQVAFLILEYLIEFEIIIPKFLLSKCLELNHNLVIDNVSCMESINRVLSSLVNNGDKEQYGITILQLLKSIVNNLNELSQTLQVDNNEKIVITKEFDDSMDEQTSTIIDKQWLFYEYKGLLKSYFRKFIKGHAVATEVIDDIKSLLQSIENVPAKTDVETWLYDI
ncbi:GCR3 protein [Scheffersomyces amazonensis]|uniref:GCR3 protein n=1 Tax=Scheffersomyces amazonensis TaxID=1078765 RepID=UPI00315DB88E